MLDAQKNPATEIGAGSVLHMSGVRWMSQQHLHFRNVANQAITDMPTTMPIPMTMLPCLPA